MSEYVAPLQDMSFVLIDLLKLHQQADVAGYEELGEDLIQPVLDEAARFVSEVVAPLNRPGDEQGCCYQAGKVTTPDGFKEAYQAFAESGWIGLAQDPAYGGQGLPHALGVPVAEMLCSANTALSLYPGLSRGVYETLHRNASEQLKSVYLPALSRGEWTGTMCISESQAGSDVGAIRSKAVCQDDGSYRISGSKIWITGGEHDLTEQIVHLVLARTPGAPAGVKGLSLFLVPKFILSADGQLGDLNTVSCTGIEHKMGINGSATCVLNFEEAEGYLVGELHGGIRHMFTVMNFERFEIALQGLGIAEHATQNAIRYARERLQGAGAGVGGQDKQPVAIIDHPDIQRTLMTMKSCTEGMRMLAYATGLAFDQTKGHQNAAVREGAQDFLDLMIPVCKSLFTDLGVELSSLGMQVFGGNGYTREYGMEQNLRDARIGPIYEGTNAIQALDLVRRKLVIHDGRLMTRFLTDADAVLQRVNERRECKDICTPLADALICLRTATDWFQARQASDPTAVLQGASEYLRAFGLVVLGYWWVRAIDALGDRQDDFALAKRQTARFFAQRVMRYQVEALLATAMNDQPLDEALI